MKGIVLPPDIKISYHAAERFLERVIERDTFTSEEVDVAIQIIKNLLIESLA